MKFYVASVECQMCAYHWVAEFPDEADEEALTCPNCGDQDSEIIEYHGPDLMGKIARGDMGEIVEYRND